VNQPVIVSVPPIRIAAAVISDSEGRVLLVRKCDTVFFMQPGGKINDGETPEAALARELNEELGCALTGAAFLGIFSAVAANEPSRTVEAALFRVEVDGDVRVGAEIEELAWVDPSQPGDLRLAPLTRDLVLPLVASRTTSAA
jgi:8-oxo-dGTP diphosphatase